jgi:ATP/maltotriose-dependent transcriptional regulator MalT
VLNWGAEFATQQGDLQRSSELAEEALQLARRLGYVVGAGIALSRLGTNADTQGFHGRGVTLLEEGLRVCLHSGDGFGIYYARHKLAEALLHDAKLDAATTLIEDNLALATRRGDRWGTAQAICQLGLVASAREDYGPAVELLEQSLYVWQSTGATRGPHVALRELGRIALVQGDPERARRLIGESLRLCRDAGNPRQIALCLHALASVAGVTGQPAQAARLFGASAALSERVAIPLLGGADIPSARGRAAAVRLLGADAFNRAWAHGRGQALEQILTAGDELVPGAIQHDETPPTRSQSATYVTRGLASTHMTALGPESGERIGRAVLTPRETEILCLVAGGKSNGDIASALVISIRTAERHLANIYTKLGTGGVVARATATSYAYTHGVVGPAAP